MILRIQLKSIVKTFVHFVPRVTPGGETGEEELMTIGMIGREIRETFCGTLLWERVKLPQLLYKISNDSF